MKKPSCIIQVSSDSFTSLRHFRHKSILGKSTKLPYSTIKSGKVIQRRIRCLLTDQGIPVMLIVIIAQLSHQCRKIKASVHVLFCHSQLGRDTGCLNAVPFTYHGIYILFCFGKKTHFLRQIYMLVVTAFTINGETIANGLYRGSMDL